VRVAIAEDSVLLRKGLTLLLQEAGHEVVAQLLARSRHPLGDLSPREREVLALMAEGRSNGAIAVALVGPGAVEKHINSIFTRLGLAPAERDHRRVLAVLTYLGTS
jgi:DNA-binding NarL/FixJ family response regulator